MKKYLTLMALIPEDGVYFVQFDNPMGSSKWSFALMPIDATPETNVLGVGQCDTYEEAHRAATEIVEGRGGQILDPYDAIEAFAR